MKRSMKLVRPLRNGQITIPAEFRQRLDITQDSVLQVTLVGRELRISPLRVTHAEAGSAWARELYEMFAPVRKDAEKYPEAEVNADIDKAVTAVRRKRASRRP